MKNTTLIFLALLLCGWGPCTPKPVAPVVAPVGPATAAVAPATNEALDAKDSALSKVSASAGVIKEVNIGQPPGPITEGVGNEAALQLTIAGPARAADEAEALKRKVVIQAGDLKQIASAYATAQTAAQAANARATKAEADLKAAQDKAKAEQDANAAILTKRIADIQAAADAQVKKVQDDARKAWMNKVNYVLLGLGALLILAAVANAWLTSGTGLAKSGILALGAALCFGLDYTLNQPWFEYVAIGAVVLTVLGAAAWAYLEWRDHQKAKATIPVDTAGQKVVKTLDAAYEAATPEAKAVLDPIFATLGNDMNDTEKDAIKLLRYKATVTASPTTATPTPTPPTT